LIDKSFAKSWEYFTEACNMFAGSAISFAIQVAIDVTGFSL